MIKIKKDTMILAQDYYVSMNCYETKLNNNVIAIGASGAGKTTGLVEPNIVQATGSYIISDPKGNLHDKYKAYLEKKGYRVIKLDFTDPLNSEKYNFFRYIRNEQDIVKIAHMLIYEQHQEKGRDPFWDEASQLLVQSVIAYIREKKPPYRQTFELMMKLINECDINENDASIRNNLDLLMESLQMDDPDSYAVRTYTKFRVACGATLKSILICTNARLGIFDTPALNEMMRRDTIDIPSIGKRKTALFVVVSDTDRSLDGLVNIFFSQAMNELCRVADKECKDCRLPVAVRFILDDFGTNVRINEFPRMISSIRSRAISTMLLLQAQSQLQQAYGSDGETILANSDTFIFLGGNSYQDAESVAKRCDVPVSRILNMPIGSCVIFRRGQEPFNGRIFDLFAFKDQMMGIDKACPTPKRRAKR